VGKVRFILEPTGMVQSAIGKRVTVLDFPDGRLVIRYEGVDLPHRTFDKIRQVKQTAIVENKRLGKPARSDPTEPGSSSCDYPYRQST